MKHRILSFVLVLALLVGVIPAAGLSVAATGEIADVGYTHLNGGSIGSNHLNAAPSDNAVDYCSILGISKTTAKRFGETIRESLRVYDFDVNLSSLKINVNDTTREKNAFFSMLEHEVFYAYDTFMFGETEYVWYRDDNNNLSRITFDKNDTLYSYNDYLDYYTAIHLHAEHLLDGVVNNRYLSDLQKALLLHDRLAAWARYDYDNQQAKTCPDESYTVVGILWDQVGVCQGYAETYAYLLDRCGIENRFAQSYDLDHIWNIVTIEGAEYYVDVTWDDPAAYDLYGQVLHDNFMVSLSKLRKDHDAYDYATIKNNTRYDNAFWTESHAEFQLVGNSLYYIDNVEPNPRYAYLRQWSADSHYSRLSINDDNAMKWSKSTSSYWTDRNFVRLDYWNGKLYVNAAKKIYEFDPITDKLALCFTTNENNSNCLYGMTVWGGRFFLNYQNRYATSDADAKAMRYIQDLKEIVSISVANKPEQYVYTVGQNYDFRGLTLKVTYADGTSALVKNMIQGWSGYNSATTGAKDFEITLFNKKTTLTLQVVKGLSTPKLTVKNADKGVTVSWGKVSYADEYILYRSTKSNGKWSDWARVTTTTKTSYTNESAKDGTVYRYAVRAWQGNLKSGLGQSGEIRRLKTPTVKVANATSGTYLTWKKITGAKTYAVYRCYRKSGKWTDWKQIGTTSKLTYTDKKASTNTAYRYAVKAVNGSQKSASGTTGEIRRLSASTVTAKKSGSTIKLSWTKVSGAKYYAVYRRVAGTSTWVKMTTTKTRAYTDKSAKKGKYYEYAVRAVSADGYMSAYKACKKVKR